MSKQRKQRIHPPPSAFRWVFTDGTVLILVKDDVEISAPNVNNNSCQTLPRVDSVMVAGKSWLTCRIACNLGMINWQRSDLVWMSCACRTIIRTKDSITVNGVELTLTNVFKYLGSMVSCDGGLLHDINHRIEFSWLKRRLYCDSDYLVSGRSAICWSRRYIARWFHQWRCMGLNAGLWQREQSVH